jgi:hypothetical protein
LTSANTERRCAKLARQCARLVLELRREGRATAAARLEDAAIEAVELVRRGML